MNNVVNIAELLHLLRNLIRLGTIAEVEHTAARVRVKTGELLTEWQRIQRDLTEFELTLALGRADILPETPLTVKGYKPQIDATAWLVAEVTHSLNDGGFGTVVRCEVKSNYPASF